MANEVYKKFMSESAKMAADTARQEILYGKINRYNAAVKQAKSQFVNLDLARNRAAYLKNKALGDLEKVLVEFEVNFEKNGGRIVWAQDAADAIGEITEIVKKYEAGYVVKSKSSVLEEIELSRHLSELGVETIETGMGEFIMQQAGEQPSHMVNSAMHKSGEEVAALFNAKFGLPATATSDQITAYIRKQLRNKFFNAKIGITGANFLVADSGSVGLTENEGNILMSTAFPEVHIVVAGIEKVIPSIRNLDVFWPLLATYGSGQKTAVYNSLISGPRQEGETDGPKEMVVILLDNNRTAVLAQTIQRRALACIRCGACLNASPVYRTIGGHAYGTTYTGPIGAVITPWMKGLNEYKHLSFASTICGSGTSVCPVKINLHDLLLHNRNDSVKQGMYSTFDGFSMFVWKKLLLNRNWMDKGSAGFKNMMLKKAYGGLWGKKRILPEVAEDSFKQLWEERREGIIRKKKKK